DPSALPLSNGATADPNDQVIGIDFSGGMASVVSQLTAALGATGLAFSNPSGTTLRVLDDGAPDLVDVDSLTATTTVTSLQGGTPELPFFLDVNAPYSGAITSTGPQSLGLAGRIVINSGLLADPSLLVAYRATPPVLAGDTTRPNFIYNQLNAASLTFSPQAGVGTGPAPFRGTLGQYLRQVVSQQGAAAADAASLKQGQDQVRDSLQQRFDGESGVNVDEEMANLLQLQTAY